MHLLVILAYAFLFWRLEEPTSWTLGPGPDALWTLVIVLIQPPLIGLGAVLAARRAERLLETRTDSPQVAHNAHHRATLCLRAAVIGGFAVSVFFTRWPEWLDTGGFSPALKIFGDLAVLSPFFVGILTLWIVAYPVERRLRAMSVGGVEPVSNRLRPGSTVAADWRFWSYLDFQVRHHVLIVAVPMTLILFAANMTRGYEARLQAWLGSIWAPDVSLGVAALVVFIASPVMLRRIWRTRSLEAGPVRERLEAVGRRVGLRFREILVWDSDGMMINAAMMGLFPPVRYVLLSDALLERLSVRQIEGVFGHEAGHVRHHHIQHFLVFAFVGWLLLVGIMELLAQLFSGPASDDVGATMAVQGIGVAVTVTFWALGFGWLSRRFERQADAFGASCVAPDSAGCRLPCSVHTGDQSVGPAGGGVCATGASIFASALERVAVLNGIPQEERSWRHSSIGSRIRFLTSLAGDPARAARFERVIRRVKTGMVTAALLGSAATVIYCYFVPQPAIM